MKVGVRAACPHERALTLSCHLLSAHHEPGLNGEHMGEGRRRPKGLGDSWEVGQVGRGTEAGAHRWLPGPPALEDITQPEWMGTWNILVRGALTGPSHDPEVTVPTTVIISSLHLTKPW